VHLLPDRHEHVEGFFCRREHANDVARTHPYGDSVLSTSYSDGSIGEQVDDGLAVGKYPVNAAGFMVLRIRSKHDAANPNAAHV